MEFKCVFADDFGHPNTWYIQALLILFSIKANVGPCQKSQMLFRVSLPCDPSVRTPRYRLAAWEAAMKDNWRNAIRAIVNEVIAAKASERARGPPCLLGRTGRGIPSNHPLIVSTRKQAKKGWGQAIAMVGGRLGRGKKCLGENFTRGNSCANEKEVL